MKILLLKDFDPQYEFPDFQRDWNRIAEIVQDVRRNGDEALKKYTQSFDGAVLSSITVEPGQAAEASAQIGPDLKKAMLEAAARIRKLAFLQKELFQEREWEIEPGVWAGQKVNPIQKAGIYVPGGRYPLISSLLMGCLPARVAGVEDITVCTPPGKDGRLHPALLAAAEMAGVNRICRVGGPQAVAAMAYGTESIPAVDKIAGPGNIYVNIAKKMVYGQVGIDFIAGPTEILVIADAGADAGWVAADLIAQAEHDERSRAVLITDSRELAQKVNSEVTDRLNQVETRDTAGKSLEKNGHILLTDSLDEAAAAADRLAPEHLQLEVRQPEKWIGKIRNYGAAFLGGYACEVLGDYSGGVNHVLPTSRVSRYCGGLSVRSFLKTQTVLKVSEEGFRTIAPAAERLAEAEGLAGHAHAVRARFSRNHSRVKKGDVS
ncbi:MAG: histidinol dehydrogenase [Candidatus Aminicenantes bacterium]